MTISKILGFLDDNKPQSLSDIWKGTHLSYTAVTRFINEGVKLKLIVDNGIKGRVRLVHISKKGRDLFNIIK